MSYFITMVAAIGLVSEMDGESELLSVRKYGVDVIMYLRILCIFFVAATTSHDIAALIAVEQ